MPTHQTLTDKEGNAFQVVSSRWLKTAVALIIVNFVVLMTITSFLIDNIQTVSQTLRYSEQSVQRNKALDEMFFKRAEIEQWTYNQVCEEVKQKGQSCLYNPQWWVIPDKDKYNLIINDPSGSGLFPVVKENK